MICDHGVYIISLGCSRETEIIQYLPFQTLQEQHGSREKDRSDYRYLLTQFCKVFRDSVTKNFRRGECWRWICKRHCHCRALCIFPCHHRSPVGHQGPEGRG